MTSPDTYKRLANQAEGMASIVSGFGEYALANGLWAFESKMRQRAVEAREQQAHDFREGRLTSPTLEQLHDWRKNGLLTREEFLSAREAIEGSAE